MVSRASSRLTAPTPAAGWALSALEYDIACAELEITQMPYPVPAARHGVTMAQRAELAAQARESLGAKGLWFGGALEADLAGALRTIADAPVTVDVLGYAGAAVRAVAARSGDVCVVVRSVGEGVEVRTVPDVTAATALLALFPDSPAGPGQSMSVPSRAFLELAGQTNGAEEFDPFYDPGQHDDTEVLRRHGVSAMDAVRVRAIAEERIRGGQFGFTSRPAGRGRSTRGDVVFSFYDTAAGRYLMVNDGTWVSITPADARRIAGRIEDAVLDAG